MTPEAATPAEAAPSARRRRRAIPWVLAVAALGLGADQVSKAAIIGGTPRVLLPGILELTYVENRGTTFGWFAGSGLVALLPWLTLGLALLLVWGWGRSARTGGRRAVVGLGLLLGGAAGNLVDRVVRGYVVDFIHLRADRIPWIDGPIFNLADVLLIGGAVLVLLRESSDARPLEP